MATRSMKNVPESSSGQTLTKVKDQISCFLAMRAKTTGMIKNNKVSFQAFIGNLFSDQIMLCCYFCMIKIKEYKLSLN